MLVPKVRKVGRIDKSGLRFGVTPRMEDEDWLRQVADMPCVILGTTPSDPAHIRWGLGGGGARKPDDNRVLPLSPLLHVPVQHQKGEVWFWRNHMTDELMMRALIAYAEKLYRKHHS